MTQIWALQSPNSCGNLRHLGQGLGAGAPKTPDASGPTLTAADYLFTETKDVTGDR
jgi:hypothetical protein